MSINVNEVFLHQEVEQMKTSLEDCRRPIKSHNIMPYTVESAITYLVPLTSAPYELISIAVLI